MHWPEGSVTFVFTDIVGSTPLVHALGERYLSLLEEHHSILREAWRAHRGTEVKTEGDSFFVAFADPTDAIRACLAAQQSLCAHTWTDDVSLSVRMGVHRGESMLLDSDYHGPAVNLAARIASSAHGGQILVSQTTVEAAHLDADVVIRDLGEHGLRGIPDPVALVQVSQLGLADSFPPPATLRAARHNLPHPTGIMRGRENELLTIDGLLRGDARVVTILGTGGVGKTRLALAAAHDLLAYHPGGVFMIEAANIANAAQLIPRIAATVGVTGDDSDPLQALASECTSATLLILDNLEHLELVGTHVAELVASVPMIKVLATTRSRLRIRAEQVVTLDPLSLPPDNASLEELQAVPSGQLFLDRARATNQTRIWTQEDAPLVARIIRGLEGVPLAIELAAARLAERSLSSVAAGLERVVDLLSEGDLDMPARQRSMLATIRWSVDLLSDSARRTLTIASVFRGGAPRDALEALAGHPIESDLQALASASLIRREDDGRVTLLEPIRAAAEELLEDRSSIVAGFIDWFADLARRAFTGLAGHLQTEWLQRATPEHANFGRVLSLAAPEQALEIASDLSRLWARTGRALEGSEWLRSLLDKTDRSAAARARAEFGLGSLLAILGRFADARIALDSAADLATSRDETEVLVLSTLTLGDVERLSGSPAKASDLIQKAVALAEQQSEISLLARAKQNLAVTQSGSDPGSAISLLTQASDAFTQCGDHYNVARCQMDKGVLSLRVGELDQASAALARAKELLREIPDPQIHARLLLNQGAVAHAAGDIATAIARTQDALELIDPHRDPRGRIEALRNLAGMLNEIERVTDALDIYEEAIRLRRDESLFGIGENLPYAAAYLALEIGEPARALRILLAHPEDLDHGPFASEMMFTLALAQNRLGYTEGALATYSAARARSSSGTDGMLMNVAASEIGSKG